MSETQAVNLCLKGVGYESVASIDEDNLDLEASEAKGTVDQKRRDLQTEGWWFNEEPNWVLKPDTKGIIVVPSNASSIVAVSGGVHVRHLSIRNGKVYDSWNHTFDMTELVGNDGSLTFTFTMVLAWSDLPPTAQTYVAYMARQQFAQDSEVDVERWKFQSIEVQQAQTAFEKQHNRSLQINMINDNATIVNKLGRIAGPNALGSRFSGNPMR